MADTSAIEWTDATWNPVTGCSVVSPGCTNCYAMKLAGTRLQHHPSRAGLTRDSKAGPVWTGEVRFNEDWLTQPIEWKAPRRIFVCAHGDLFHEAVPDEVIDKVFAVMAVANHHTFQLPTKRSARMKEYLLSDDLNYRISAALGTLLDGDWVWKAGKPHRKRIEELIERFLGHGVDRHGDSVYHDDPMPLPNVWLGVSVEDQTRADERIPDLLRTPAAKRFLSCEPLLGPVDLGDISATTPTGIEQWNCLSREEAARAEIEGGDDGFIDWVIAGGESGPGARPAHPDWVRSLRDQCQSEGVPFFFKQWGEWAPGDAFGLVKADPIVTRSGHVRDWLKLYVVCEERADRLDGHSFTTHLTNLVYRVGKARAGAMLDGREWQEMPK